MTAPLPRGFVRLTRFDGKPLLFPAKRCVVSMDADSAEECLRVGVCGDVPYTVNDPPMFWHVRETFDQIQAALVAALGAQYATAEYRGDTAEEATYHERARCLAIVKAHENTDPDRAFDAICAAIEGGGA